MTSLPHLLFRITVSFEITKFFMSGPIWLKFGSGQVIGSDSKSEMIFHIRANIKSILGISCNFALQKATGTPQQYGCYSKNSRHR